MLQLTEKIKWVKLYPTWMCWLILSPGDCDHFCHRDHCCQSNLWLWSLSQSQSSLAPVQGLHSDHELSVRWSPAWQHLPDNEGEQWVWSQQWVWTQRGRLRGRGLLYRNMWDPGRGRRPRRGCGRGCCLISRHSIRKEKEAIPRLGFLYELIWRR